MKQISIFRFYGFHPKMEKKKNLKKVKWKGFEFTVFVFVFVFFSFFTENQSTKKKNRKCPQVCSIFAFFQLIRKTET